jgi:hypothetical protein
MRTRDLSKPSHSNRRTLCGVGLAALLSSAALACSSGGGSGAEDCTSPDGAAQGDAQPPPTDAGNDATRPDAATPDASTADATTPDATTPDAGTDANEPSDGGEGGASAEAGLDCAAILAKMMSAPVLPPNGWLGLDLSGAPGSTGLTIDQAGVLACATSVEPSVFVDGGSPFQAGARTASFAIDGGAALTISYNLQSRVIWNVQTVAPATSTLTFHARPGGAYDTGNPDGGPSVYAIGFGADGDGGAGYVTKNGQNFAADWTISYDDAGVGSGSAWANEIYDGLVATYAPWMPAVLDCFESPYERPIVAQRESACLLAGDIPGVGGILGVRPLGVYIVFQANTNQAQSMYQFTSAGWPSCATPEAALELLTYNDIQASGNYSPPIGPLWSGTWMGGLAPADPVANSAGMLASEANAIAGCGAVAVTPPDPGYAAEEWGGGEMELEYNVDSGVAYKLFAKKGYKGTLDMTVSEADAGPNEYNIGVESLTLNGAPVTLDWTDGDAGTLNAAITDISNAWLAEYCGWTDTDCVQGGDCVITPDDGQGHSTFTLVTAPWLVPYCGDQHPLTFVFPKGANAPAEIYATNPGGQ